MLVYTFDRTLDGLLSAVFDAFSLRQQPEMLVGKGEPLPLFCEEVHEVVTSDDRAGRVWAGLEKRLSRQAVKLLMVSYLSELPELDTPLFHYICKVFRQPEGRTSIERNLSDPDVLAVTNIGRKVIYEQHRMLQFLRFQKAKDGTYLGVVSPDHDVLPLTVAHFRDRFGDQPWLIYDAKRRYGFYYDQQEVTRITFQQEDSLPFDLDSGKLRDDLLSENEKVFQELWRTYFKAICIRERMNPRKQLKDMPRRYWKYMTEKQ
ncbi:MAG: TIGR03915 family putative DNA repair protein [Bacteroidaceae bacterium]|nr:TIGR03915 family putative DNA repair protein [Bacteroidaceae bacterium]